MKKFIPRNHEKAIRIANILAKGGTVNAKDMRGKELQKEIHENLRVIKNDCLNSMRQIKKNIS